MRLPWSLKTVAATDVVKADLIVKRDSDFGIVIGDGVSAASALTPFATGAADWVTAVEPAGVASNWPAWITKPIVTIGSDGIYRCTNYSAETFNVARTYNYYVDCVGGNDSNNGLTAGTAKKTWAACRGLITSWSTMHSTKFWFTPGIYKAVASTGGSLNGGQVGPPATSGCTCECVGGIATMINDPLGYDGTELVEDTAPVWMTPAAYAGDRVYDFSNLDQYGAPVKLTLASSLSNCQATANSYWPVPSGALYVRLFDGRKPDRNVVVTNGTVNTSPLWMKGQGFIKNMRYVGYIPGNLSARLYAHSSFVFKNCQFIGANATSNCFQVTNDDCFIFLEDCRAFYANDADGFNLHKATSMVDAGCLSVRTIACHNGGIGGGNNGETSHDGWSVVRVDCKSFNNGQRNIHDINAPTLGMGVSWNCGCAAGIVPAGSSNGTAFSVGGGGGDNLLMYLDGCTVVDGNLEYALNASASTLGFYTRNMDTSSMTKTGPGPTAY